MGQAKSKVECPLCGGRRSDTDDACDSDAEPSSSPEKQAPSNTHHHDADKPLLMTPDHRDDHAGGGGHASTASLPSYVGTGPLTSVAEEPGHLDDDDALAENHTTSLRHQLVVLRGNRHHPPGHRVRSVPTPCCLEQCVACRRSHV